MIFMVLFFSILVVHSFIFSFKETSPIVCSRLATENGLEVMGLLSRSRIVLGRSPRTNKYIITLKAIVGSFVVPLWKL